MIYELNGGLHFELSPDVMRKLVTTVDEELNEMGSKDTKLVIGLSNFRSALQCELDRMADGRQVADKVADKPEADPNADLLG